MGQTGNFLDDDAKVHPAAFQICNNNILPAFRPLSVTDSSLNCKSTLIYSADMFLLYCIGFILLNWSCATISLNHTMTTKAFNSIQRVKTEAAASLLLQSNTNSPQKVRPNAGMQGQRRGVHRLSYTSRGGAQVKQIRVTLTVLVNLQNRKPDVDKMALRTDPLE